MFVEYSNLPGKLLQQVNDFSGNRLKKKADLEILFEELLTKGKEQLLDEIAFTSKYVMGLMRVLKQGSNTEIGNVENIKMDMSANMENLVEELKAAVKNAEGNTKQHFHRTYFELTQQALTNLYDLLSDLEWTKKFLNEQKRKSL